MPLAWLTDSLGQVLHDGPDLKTGGFRSSPNDFANRRHTHAIAVVLPMTGHGAILGPSCIASAQLAISEVNEAGGIADRKLEAVYFDAGVTDPNSLAGSIGKLVDAGAIGGVVSMCRTDIRRLVDLSIAGRVPSIFTPVHNGVVYSPNLFLLGPGPEDVIAPGVQHLIERRYAKRWAMIGYPWTAVIANIITRCGGEIVFERYVQPQDPLDLERLLDELVRSRPQVVAVALAGEHCYEFHRVFGELDLHKRMLQFSPITEENALMAIGAENTRNLLVSATYFSSLETEPNLAFKERYHKLHGPMAPALNHMSQSVYEGVQFYASLTRKRLGRHRDSILYRSELGTIRSIHQKDFACFLAEADGHILRVEQDLKR